MADPEELVGADKYNYSREVFRDRAKSEFFARKHARSLVEITNDYVAGTMFAGSGHDISDLPNAEYVSDLIVSFTRTHFIIVDLIVCSELIDSATLLRKQFELIARLHELSAAKTIDDLLERTPNLRALKTDIKKLYGEYSQIAHSAHPKPLELLGRIERDEGEYTPLYPMFSENSYVALNHAFVCVVEYYLWAHPFASSHWPNYHVTWGQEWLGAAVEIHNMMFEA